MFDSLRGLIKWIVITLLIILIVFLLVKISGGSSENKKDSLNDGYVIEDPIGVENSSDEEFEDMPYQEIVDVEDTASTAGASVIIGSMIIGGTTFYIRKKKTI